MARIRNDDSNPTKSPRKRFGRAAGMATRKIKYPRPAPRVRATSEYEVGTFMIPDMVSIVTGNQTAKAISATPGRKGPENRIMAVGIRMVAGIGPRNFITGTPQ